MMVKRMNAMAREVAMKVWAQVERRLRMAAEGLRALARWLKLE